MEKLFLAVLNMSMTASLLIIAVLLIRLVLKKAPRWISGLLWGIVAVRLICPFSIESIFSLIPSAEPIPQEITVMEEPQVTTGIQIVNSVVNPILEGHFSPDSTAVVNPMQSFMTISSAVWMVGIFGLLVYAAISYLLLCQRVKGSIPWEKRVRLCDYIETPFILGVIRPRIYLPSGLTKEQYAHVIAHEEAHLSRGDHIWKPLGFLILAVHWFNPFVWVAYILLCKDIEIACDEKVIRAMEEDSAATYAQTLLDCSRERRFVLMCPIAFGEVSVKERIKHVLNFRKPTIWVIIAAMIACIVVAICFLTNPKGEDVLPIDGQQGNIEDLDSTREVIDKVDADPIYEGETTQEEGQKTDETLPDKTWQSDLDGGYSYGEYTDELLFNFGGSFLLSDTYEEPKHGEGAPEGWYALGGAGICIDPSYADRETFESGKLIGYDWLDNHSGCAKLAVFCVGEYSCCLYQYQFDLFTAPQVAELKEETKLLSEYWVVFYTKGEGKPLYLKFFNCDYFSRQQAMENIAPGAAILLDEEAKPVISSVENNEGNEFTSEVLAYINRLDDTTLAFDRVEWVTVPSERAAELGIAVDDAPNGFRVYNETEKAEELPLADNCSFKPLDWYGNYERIDVTREEMQRILDERKGTNIPYHLMLENNKIVEIVEQYVP